MLSYRKGHLSIGYNSDPKHKSAFTIPPALSSIAIGNPPASQVHLRVSSGWEPVSRPFHILEIDLRVGLGRSVSPARGSTTHLAVTGRCSSLDIARNRHNDHKALEDLKKNILWFSLYRHIINRRLMIIHTPVVAVSSVYIPCPVGWHVAEITGKWRVSRITLDLVSSHSPSSLLPCFYLTVLSFYASICRCFSIWIFLPFLPLLSYVFIRFCWVFTSLVPQDGRNLLKFSFE